MLARPQKYVLAQGFKTGSLKGALSGVNACGAASVQRCAQGGSRFGLPVSACYVRAPTPISGALPPRNLQAPPVTAISRADHDRMANAIRALAMDAVEQAKSGHPGMPMGTADIATVLFSRFLKFDPADPHWPDRDRFVLSAGHGSMLIYALLHLTGYKSVPLDQIRRFRQIGSTTPGHPENHVTKGVEMTTGPLGQGIATSVGMALAERHLAGVFGDIVDHRTYVLASDGDLMEGVSQEAIALAGHLKLNRLIVLFDDNGITIDGKLSLSDSVDQIKRFEAAGWRAERIDGHDPDAIAAALARAQDSDRPSLIACKTTIAFGAPTKAGSEKSHGSPLGSEEIAGARQKLGWTHAAFEIPDDIRALWTKAGQRGGADRAAWQKRLAGLEAAARTEFERRIKGELPEAALAAAVKSVKETLAATPKDIATRSSSEFVLETLTQTLPEMIGGSADLTGSNNTRTKATKPLSAADYAGRFIHYGIREHGMAAAMNGMALHRGIIPYSGTFLVFSDYCRPAIRLAALMGERVIYVLTHDSIGLGEDGPTHQPVEHLAALRAMPNLLVFRPCDAVETLECWELALRQKDRPSVLALTRQNLPQLRTRLDTENVCARGAYVIAGPDDGEADVSIFASGSEVPLAVDAAKLIAAKGVSARVVSVPCFELFREAPQAYRMSVLGRSRVRVGVEAAVRQGWDELIGADGLFVGMKSFGASAPFKELYRHFGITPEAVADLALKQLGKD
ncbi:MAG: transketolase [Pseudorhodoplanes sp.]|nr:transketolase [Pseudorhodoplanes sp.]